MDACERLGQLNLTEIQQREIVRVLLHCCGNVRTTLFSHRGHPTQATCLMLQEKVYNPYYTLICQELCRFSHSYKITLQFCLWDFLRELGESNVGGVELLKRQDELRFSSQGKSITRCKLENTARAYSWWVAKDCCSLTIFKVRTLAIQHSSHLLTRSVARRLFGPQGPDQKLPQGIPIAALC